MDKNDRLKLFITELNYIKDDNLRNFAGELLTNADDYFFTVAASSTGKYHPSISLGVGGLVRHTKAVVYFLKEMLRADLWGFNEHQVDLMIISAIAHDIKKQGDGSTNYTVKNHPVYASDFIKKINKTSDYKLDKTSLDFICNAVEAHMGQWGDKIPQTESEKIVHLADLIASRKEVTLNLPSFSTEVSIDNVNTPIASKSAINENIEPKDYICTFGKHKGKALIDIPVEYMQWAISAGISQTEFVEMSKKFISTLE